MGCLVRPNLWTGCGPGEPSAVAAAVPARWRWADSPCELNDWQAMGLAGWGNWILTQSQTCPAGKFWLVWERPL